MGEIARSDREIIIFYNPNGLLADKTLAYANAEGLPVREVDILQTPLTETQLEEFAHDLQIPVSDLANQQHPNFEEHFGQPDLSEADWLKILNKNPELINEPIVLLGSKTILVKTPSDVLKLSTGKPL